MELKHKHRFETLLQTVKDVDCLFENEPIHQPTEGMGLTPFDDLLNGLWLLLGNSYRRGKLVRFGA